MNAITWEIGAFIVLNHKLYVGNGELNTINQSK